MMLLPAATDTPAASVMVMLVPVLLPVAVPTFLTKAMPARASHAARPRRRASASVARARRAGFLHKSTFMVSEGSGNIGRRGGGLEGALRGPAGRLGATRGGEDGRRAQSGSPGGVPKAASWGRRAGKEETRLADLLGYGRLALVVSGKERGGTLRLCGAGKMCDG